MNQPIHDYIVLGASLAGVVFAVRKSLAGHSVLLVNHYGFPGGSITEQLNCLQETGDADLHGLALTLHQAISPAMPARSIVDPEAVKYSLQQFLENTSVDLLYHVLPKKIDVAPDGSVGVTLLTKEGSALFRGRKVLDASETYSGAALLGRARTLRERSVNVFTTRPADENFLGCEKIIHAVKLSDGRYWISLRNDTQDDLFAENDTQTLVDAFGTILERSHCRIQVLPLQAQAIYDLEDASGFPGAFATIDDILGTRFGQSKEFFKASMIETEHTHF